MIFVLIAGTYTPFALLVLHGPLATAILIAVWSCVVAGAVLKLLWVDAPKALMAALYVALGLVSLVDRAPAARPPRGRRGLRDRARRRAVPRRRRDLRRCAVPTRRRPCSATTSCSTCSSCSRRRASTRSWRSGCCSGSLRHQPHDRRDPDHDDHHAQRRRRQPPPVARAERRRRRSSRRRSGPTIAPVDRGREDEDHRRRRVDDERQDVLERVRAL